MPTVQEMLNALTIMNNQPQQQSANKPVSQQPVYGAEPVKTPFDAAGNIMSFVNQFRQKYPNWTPLPIQQTQAQLQSQALADALAEAGLTGMYQGKPTFERALAEAGLTGLYQGKPTWERQYQQQQLANSRIKASAPSAPEKLTATERTIDIRSQAANAVQDALDELWKKHPNGPSYAAVAETAKTTLDQVKADLIRAGIAQKDINDIIKTLKDYISTVTGVPRENLGFTTPADEMPNLTE